MKQQTPIIEHIPQPLKDAQGLGDVVAAIAQKLGIKPCEGCKKRQAALNEKFPFRTPNA